MFRYSLIATISILTDKLVGISIDVVYNLPSFTKLITYREVEFPIGEAAIFSIQCFSVNLFSGTCHLYIKLIMKNLLMR